MDGVEACKVDESSMCMRIQIFPVPMGGEGQGWGLGLRAEDGDFCMMSPFPVSSVDLEFLEEFRIEAIQQKEKQNADERSDEKGDEDAY